MLLEGVDLIGAGGFVCLFSLHATMFIVHLTEQSLKNDRKSSRHLDASYSSDSRGLCSDTACRNDDDD